MGVMEPISEETSVTAQIFHGDLSKATRVGERAAWAAGYRTGVASIGRDDVCCRVSRRRCGKGRRRRSRNMKNVIRRDDRRTVTREALRVGFRSPKLALREGAIPNDRSHTIEQSDRVWRHWCIRWRLTELR